MAGTTAHTRPGHPSPVERQRRGHTITASSRPCVEPFEGFRSQLRI